MDEPKVTFEQIEPALHKHALYFERLTCGRFEKWELINEAWLAGVRDLPQSKVKFASARIKWDMIHYIRTENDWRLKRRIHCIPISQLDNDEDGQPFVERYVVEDRRQEAYETIVDLIRGRYWGLNRHEKLLLRLVFIDGLTFSQASAKMGYSKSWGAYVWKWLKMRIRSLQDVA